MKPETKQKPVVKSGYASRILCRLHLLQNNKVQ